MNRIYVKRIFAKDIGPFSNLRIHFRSEPGLSLICGDNGIGKTTVLEIIASCFSAGYPIRIKKRASSEIGSLSINICVNEREYETEGVVNSFEPEHNSSLQLFGEYTKFLINIRASRDILYQRRDTVNRDPSADQHAIAARSAAGLDASEIKQWFSNRNLLRPHAEAGGWTSSMMKNIATAERLFSIIDPSVSLDRVDVRTYDIYVSTPSGRIPYEYLSSGFKSAYVLLLGVIKEIEFRNIDVAAEDFSGVILIDEIDLHLHPTWQRKIGRIMREVFPLAQIIATTHSPHVIQTAEAVEVVALERLANGAVSQREIPSVQHGYLGWTIDEVLEDVMGVTDTKSDKYVEAVRRFDQALDQEDPAKIKAAMLDLDGMLHPSNPYRKLIKIQAAPFAGDFE
ncbi:AAA family ATPase [uncultured Sphingomonas sp.]|uniref:AAA family ATPase n=1 Tax=uncultured Sphingomonas sp. TaxID=158754 RepID=UPI0025DB7272|nr:AAA family ATPase [uncultured Sphingomonas sp.]